jgi:hypothetical protein
LSSDAKAGAAAGQLSIRLDGALAGGVWKGVRASGSVVSRWDFGDFTADAPNGAVIEWQSAAYGDTKFGAAALRYTPIGRLVERSGDDLVGRGKLAAVRMPVTGAGYAADIALDADDLSSLRDKLQVCVKRQPARCDAMQEPARSASLTAARPPMLHVRAG